MATTTGIRSFGRETGCYVVAYAMADEGDETQTGFGFSVGPRASRPRRRAPPRPRPPSGPPACSAPAKPPTGRLTVVLDPWVTAQFLGIARLHAQRRGGGSRAARCSPTASARRWPSPLVTLVDDPTDPRAITATDTDGEGLATRRNVLDRRRRARDVRAQRLHRPAGRHASHRQRGAGLQVARPASAACALSLAPGTTDPADAASPASTTACWCRRSPACTRA